MANDISNLLGRFGANTNGYLEVENTVEYKDVPRKPVVKPVAPAVAAVAVNESASTPPAPEKPSAPSPSAPHVNVKHAVAERVEPVIEDLPPAAAAVVTPAPVARVEPAAPTVKKAAVHPVPDTPAADPAPTVSLRSLLNEVAQKREAQARSGHQDGSYTSMNAVPPGTPAQVIAVVSPKGGVGRTTIAAALAGSLKRKGRAIAIDLDCQNALQYHLGVSVSASASAETNANAGAANWNALLLDGASGTHVLPYGVIPEQDRAAFESGANADSHWLARQLSHMNLRADDVVVLDAPAGRGSRLDQILSVADQVVLVVTPDAGSFMALDHLAPLLDARGDCCYIVNQFDASRTFSQDMLEVLKRRIGTKLIGVIPLDHAISESLAYGVSSLVGGEQTPAKQQIEAIADTLKADAHASALAGGRAS